MKVTIEVSTKQISDTLISALEGGSNYWYMIEDEGRPTSFLFENDDGERYRTQGQHWMQDYPLNPGGYLVFSSMEEEELQTFKLNVRSIKRGLIAMAQKYPGQFGNMLSDDGDGTTGDVFLQCCLFGDVIYS